MPPRTSLQLREIAAFIGGGVLGAALAALVLIELAWITLDPCVTEPPIPLGMIAFLESVGAVGGVTIVHVLEIRAVRVWLAAVAGLVLVIAFWFALLGHAVHAALDCTWKVNPPVPETR